MNRYDIILGRKPSKKAIAKERAAERAKAAKARKRAKARKKSRDGVKAHRRAIHNILASSEGRRRLAASLIQPLHTRLDYSGVARRAFSVEPLPEGALPVYGRPASLKE